MSSRLFSLPHRLLGIHPVQEVGRNVSHPVPDGLRRDAQAAGFRELLAVAVKNGKLLSPEHCSSHLRSRLDGVVRFTCADRLHPSIAATCPSPFNGANIFSPDG